MKRNAQHIHAAVLDRTPAFIAYNSNVEPMPQNMFSNWARYSWDQTAQDLIANCGTMSAFKLGASMRLLQRGLEDVMEHLNLQAIRRREKIVGEVRAALFNSILVAVAYDRINELHDLLDADAKAINIEITILYYVNVLQENEIS